MEDKFKKGYNKPFSGSESYRHHILLITKQLNENHRVIVTGNNNDLNYKCAYAAIKGIYQCIDQCLEINDPSEWRLITSENAKLVLFNEPFGRLKYDERKYEAMIVEIDEMLSATQEKDDDRIDIVIVANKRHLEEAKDHRDHEMLCTSSVVEIDSSNIVDKRLVVDDTIHRNLLAMAKTFKEAYIPKEVDNQAKEIAKRLFIDQSMVAIIGPTGSGKTSLSFELLPLYDLSDGEDNFVVISDPSELKFVNLSQHPVIIIKSLCGVKFNHAEAHRWFSQLDRLYAAVKINQIAVIITIESKVFERIQSHMPPHQLLAHTVKLTSSSVNESEKRSKDTIDCEVQTDNMSLDVLPEGNSTQAGATVDENNLRSVKGFREYRISRSKIFSSNRCRIISFSILPSGEILLIEYSGKLIKLNIDFKVISTLQIGNGVLRSCVCYTGKDIAVILNQDQLLFVNIKKDMSLINSRSISHKCYSLACYDDKLYVIDKYSVYVYSTDGDFLKDLYESRHTMLEFIDIAVRNDGSMIFIMTDAKKLISIDNLGNNLFMLDIPDIEGVLIGNQIRLCVGFHDNVFIFGEIQKGSNQKKIVQVHPCSRSCRVILQFESDIDYSTMQYDCVKHAIMLAGNSNILTVLELR
ncbi:uncharacterized protein LOC132720655 [Ruditapes philippinarum]|uniref:uncharacterized protein LOC132720655 n=1 Tax=Ruditapes philippinarum TaxID=129788 RepID=UPI00295B3423|nr:uncharacterized protein LOC132720655 [Ruditapes philippinarum]